MTLDNNYDKSNNNTNDNNNKLTGAMRKAPAVTRRSSTVLWIRIPFEA